MWMFWNPDFYETAASAACYTHFAWQQLHELQPLLRSEADSRQLVAEILRVLWNNHRTLISTKRIRPKPSHIFGTKSVIILYYPIIYVWVSQVVSRLVFWPKSCMNFASYQYMTHTPLISYVLISSHRYFYKLRSFSLRRFLQPLLPPS
jgi:hypothetical protein